MFHVNLLHIVAGKKTGDVFKKNPGRTITPHYLLPYLCMVIAKLDPTRRSSRSSWKMAPIDINYA